MNQLLWWCLALHFGVSGSMATVGTINVQWWFQDKSERLLGWTGVLCWSVTCALLVGAVGVAFPTPTVWDVVMPVRSVLIGIIPTILLAILSVLVPLKGIRTAITLALALPIIFAITWVIGDSTYTLVGDSAWPRIEPLGLVLIGGSVLLVGGYSVLALTKMAGARRLQFGAAIGAAAALLVVGAGSGADLLGAAMATLWTLPIAILLTSWSSARVLNLQGSLLSAEAGRRLAEHTAEHRDRHDELTGLPNRRGAEETLQALLDSADPERPVMVSKVRVNRLDQLRASEGSLAADAVLHAIARYLLVTLPPDAAVARVSETSFVVMMRLTARRPGNQIEALVSKSLGELSRTIVQPAELSLTVGVAIADDFPTARELLQQARIAVAAAEQTGRSVQLFRPDLLETIVHRARTARLLAAAAGRDEFELHYQPVLDTLSLTRVGVEALVRWRHHGRLHSPAEWIPIAEEQGLMPTIGLAVLRIAVRDHAVLQCPIAVNVSARQLAEPDFAATVLDALQAMPPAALTLEVTESCVMADVDEARIILETFRSHGIRIALDDFGTQYSSLSRLASMPFDIIKIDRSFVSRVLSTDGRAMVTAIHAMASALGKVTVAEGVETSEQLQALTEIGCDRVQGFLTGRPAPLTDFLPPDLAADCTADYVSGDHYLGESGSGFSI